MLKISKQAEIRRYIECYIIQRVTALGEKIISSVWLSPHRYSKNNDFSQNYHA
jgi:hypothetical protein